MTPGRSVLVVDGDRACALAMAMVLRRRGDSVTLASSRRAALLAARRSRYDLALVDLLIGGSGGPDLARLLARRVGRLVLTVGARLRPDEVLEAVLGFPVRSKSDV